MHSNSGSGDQAAISGSERGGGEFKRNGSLRGGWMEEREEEGEREEMLVVDVGACWCSERLGRGT